MPRWLLGKRLRLHSCSRYDEDCEGGQNECRSDSNVQQMSDPYHLSKSECEEGRNPGIRLLQIDSDGLFDHIGTESMASPDSGYSQSLYESSVYAELEPSISQEEQNSEEPLDLRTSVNHHPITCQKLNHQNVTEYWSPAELLDIHEKVTSRTQQDAHEESRSVDLSYRHASLLDACRQQVQYLVACNLYKTLSAQAQIRMRKQSSLSSGEIVHEDENLNSDCTKNSNHFSSESILKNICHLLPAYSSQKLEEIKSYSEEERKLFVQTLNTSLAFKTLSPNPLLQNQTAEFQSNIKSSYCNSDNDIDSHGKEEKILNDKSKAKRRSLSMKKKPGKQQKRRHDDAEMSDVIKLFKGDIDSSLTMVEATPEARAEIDKIENKIGDYVCMLCLKRFEDAFLLAGHNCSCIAHIEYRCPECSKTFNCPANLASHRRWHRPKSLISVESPARVKHQKTSVTE